MSDFTPLFKKCKVLAVVCLGAIFPILTFAQDNPYQVVYYWGELPGGRPMGVVTGVQPDIDGEIFGLLSAAVPINAQVLIIIRFINSIKKATR
ncbi:MAG: hypothetical protein Ct9H300mP19_16320 [Dehalococcoidia bacterium]|nr:MAG: hypothetical protein Ct9H300mP19_16320 [Dehalococcoidia bacterium]